MASYPSFHFPSMTTQANSAFAPVRVDFSKIGQIYDSYTDAKNNRLKQDAFREEQAARQAERARQDQVRQIFAQGMPRDAQGNIDFNAAAERLIALDPSQGVDFLKIGRDEKKFAADEAYRQQQLGLQREQLTPSNVREYSFYAEQERAAGREPMGYADWQMRAKEGATTYGKTGSVFQGPDGKFYSVQFGADGSRVILPLEIPGRASQTLQGPAPLATEPQSTEGASVAPAAAPPMPLTPSRGVREVDTGTGTQVIDAATGLPVRNVPKDIAGAEAAKVEGKHSAELKAELPKARAKLRALETQHRNVRSTIERALPMVNAWTAGLAGQSLSKLGGTDANNLRTLLNTIKANLGFDKLQDMRDNSPTGGALGQVAVAELEMLQAAFASVEQSQTAAQLKENLTYLFNLIEEMQDNRRIAFDETYGAGSRPQPSPKATKTFNWSPDGGLQEVK